MKIFNELETQRLRDIGEKLRDNRNPSRKDMIFTINLIKKMENKLTSTYQAFMKYVGEQNENQSM